MRIAFYAPLKAPSHPVPSGDRQMARMLVRALGMAGHQVEIISELRAFAAGSEPGVHDAMRAAAVHEIERIAAEWSRSGPPDLWFCYHPYHKAPDFLADALANRFGLPVVTVEASWSARRGIGAWVDSQAMVADMVRSAAVNICLREKDRAGLLMAVPDARCEMLLPFIDTTPFRAVAPDIASRTMVTVAMMRPGDKLESYTMLARALERLDHLPWRLVVAGDGPAREQVMAEFARLDPARIEWQGEVPSGDVAKFYAHGTLYVWPGFGEAYGLAYLEAQASGLPVVAQAIDGVPGVVRDGETGMLTPPRDAAALAGAIATLLEDGARRRAMSVAARRFVLEERSLEIAARRLGEILGAVRGRGDA